MMSGTAIRNLVADAGNRNVQRCWRCPMDFNLMPLYILGLLLVLAVIALAAYRKILAMHEDDALHVVEGSAAVSRQVTLAHKLRVIDRWLQVTTVVMVVCLIIIGVIYFYQQWMRISAM
jgi:hypothetical protein